LLVSLTASETPPATSAQFWSRVPYDEAVFGGGFEQVMASVTVGGPGLVAVGQAGFTDQKAAVWTSPDGITWSRVPDNEALFGGAIMNSVTVGGPGLVAVGSSEPNAAAVWTSVDGIAWSRVPYDEAVFGGELGVRFGGAAMSSVTVGGPGLVAVGSYGSPRVAAVWTSPDGITWSRVPHDEAVFGGEDDGYYGQSMSSVTAGGSGLVAVGSDVGRAAVWTSLDGITWSRVPHDEAVFGGAGMSSVTVGGPGLVAVGGADGERAVVWTSVDGFIWSRLPDDDAVFGEAGMRSVTVGGQSLVAVGSGVGDGGLAKAWASLDGITWSRVPYDEAVFGGRPEITMWSVTAFGTGLVAVGGDGFHTASGPSESNAAVWVTEND